MNELARKTATELLGLLGRRDVSAVEVLESVYTKIDAREGAVRAYLSLADRDTMRRQAADVDRRRAAGEAVGPLGGLPVAVKDNICTRDLPTTCASRILGNFRPPYDATVVGRLRRADGLIIGKTNMDEFAMGSSTENSAFQKTANPVREECVPGGSSGGSAAAVAADMAVLALGSDTGGSIRQPAAFCGIVGMKPTYGRVSRYGLVAYGSSLDQIGPLARSVADAALLLDVIAGHDPLDSTSLPDPYRPAGDLAGGLAKLRIGVPKEYFGDALQPALRRAIERTLQQLAADGHEIVDVSLPNTKYAIPVYYLIACAEASSNLARYDGSQYGHRTPGTRDIIEMMSRSRDEGFGNEVKRRIILGTYVLSAGYFDAYYMKAARVRTLIKRDFEAAFGQCDVLMHPIAPGPAFKAGEKTSDPLEMYLQDIYSVTANLAGIPAISLPVGATADGLPLAVQVTGRVLDEARLLRVAARIEAHVAAAGGWTGTTFA